METIKQQFDSSEDMLGLMLYSLPLNACFEFNVFYKKLTALNSRS